MTVVLPLELNANKLAWFSVWCRDLSVNFGHIGKPGSSVAL